MSTVERGADVEVLGESDYPIVKITDRWVAVLWGPRDQWAVVQPFGVTYRLREPLDKGEGSQDPSTDPPAEPPKGYPVVPDNVTPRTAKIREGYL